MRPVKKIGLCVVFPLISGVRLIATVPSTVILSVSSFHFEVAWLGVHARNAFKAHEGPQRHDIPLPPGECGTTTKRSTE